MIGTVVGHYRVTERLSAGGMGIVYRAEHTLLGKPAAIKILHPELSTNRDIVNRFFTEAKATTSIRHVGIVEVFDFGYLESGHAYLVMELLDGEPLSAAVRRGRFGQTAALALLRGVCSALSAAHAKGIVHRDLKPDNIFLVPDADAPFGVRAKLLDFGIAKLTDVESSVSATRTGAVMGTPTYMSPEQCSGRGMVDHRADLYSLGCVLYELVCGRPPFTSHGAGELIGAHLHVMPESPRVHAPELSPPLERLILSLLAKNPAERPQSAAELMQRFDELARSGVLSGISYDLSGHGGHTGSLHAPGGALTPVPPMATPASGAPVSWARPPDAPTVATPYSLPRPGAASAPMLGPTTLSGATGATGLSPPRPRRGRVWALAGVVVVAALAVGGVLIGTGGTGGTRGSSSSPASQPAPEQATGVGAPAAQAPPDPGAAAAGPGAGAGSSTGAASAAPAATSAAASPDAGPVEVGAALLVDAGLPDAATSAAAAPPPAGKPPRPHGGKSRPNGKGKGKPSEVPTLIEDDI